MHDVLFTIKPEKGLWVVAPPLSLKKTCNPPATKSKVEAIHVAREVAVPVAPAVIEVYAEQGFLDERIYIDYSY